MNSVPKQYLIEKIFEAFLWFSRFIVILAVLFGLVSTIMLFIMASSDVYKAAHLLINDYVFGISFEHQAETIIGKIIGAVDLYLIGIVLLIFSFGVYELFISKIDIAKKSEQAKALEISSLEELKDKITKVIIMVLIVLFFKRALTMDFSTPLEMFFLALSIFVLALGLYFLYKSHKEK